MVLANFTAPALIFPHIKGAGGSVLFELCRALQSQQCVPDWLGLYDAVLRKPSLASVNATAEIAFPHGRIAGVEHVSFAFGRCDKPISWGPDGSFQVRLVFLISAPENDPSHYRALLSGLIRMTKSQSMVDALRGATDMTRCLEIFGSLSVPGKSARPNPSARTSAQAVMRK